MSASSDEQYRLEKMVEGANGMNEQDAVDEEIDNALDENATEIDIKFEKNICRKIENNGRPLSSEDRTNILTLDTRSKSKNHEKKGQYGVGGTISKARLAGQGIAKITSKDGNDVYQTIIDFEFMLIEYVGKDAWTGEHDKKPEFRKIKDESSYYKEGVTKEYIGDKLKQRFHLEDVVRHIAIKYNNQIKNGVTIRVIWDDEIYKIPDIFAETKNIIEFKWFMSSDGDSAHFIDNNAKIHGVMTTSNGDLRHNILKSRPITNNEKQFKIQAYFPNLPTVNSVRLNEKDNIRSCIINEKMLSMFKNIKPNETGDKLIMDCEHSSIEFDCSPDSSQFNKFIQELKSKFIPGLIIDKNEYTLCYQDYDKTTPCKKTPEGDRYAEYMLVKLIVDHDISITQENKNSVTLTRMLRKCIDVSIDVFNKNIKKEADQLKKNIIEKQNLEKQEKEKEEEEVNKDEVGEVGEVGEEEKNEVNESQRVSTKTKNPIQKKPITVHSYSKHFITKENARKTFEEFLTMFPDENVAYVEPMNSMQKYISENK